jgi:hypothetical protein
MSSVSNQTLKPIIESRSGIHLTAYLEKTREVSGMRLQIHESIETAKELLISKMSPVEIDAFLAPLQKLLNDERTLRSMRHNIAIFRKEDSFRMINLPVDVEHITVVADSYHVKPLLKWTQNTRQFVWIDFRGQDCRVCVGDELQVRMLDVFRFRPEGSDLKRDVDMSLLTESILDLNSSNKHGRGVPVFLTGDLEVCKTPSKILRRSGISVKYLRYVAESDSHDKVVERIRRYLSRQAIQRLANAIREFQVAGAMNTAAKSISQIAKLAVKGKVKKLMVAEDYQMFGKINRETGDLNVTPVQMDHTDDDLLDDIAQQVIASGGEVLVTSQQWIPGNRPAIAIIDSDGSVPLVTTIYDVASRRAV